MVADALEMQEFRAGQAVFRQGEAGQRFYILKEGTGAVGWWVGWWWWVCGLWVCGEESAIKGANVPPTTSTAFHLAHHFGLPK